MSDPRDLTALLRAAREGDAQTVDHLFDEVYSQLRQFARAQRRHWDGDHTLNTTALVHEAYLKLIKQPDAGWQDRVHFMRVASKAMRHILVNYAERRCAQKRGGGAEPLTLDDANPIAPEAAEEILHLHEALERLGKLAPRPVQVVECRFFTGLTVRETASALGVSRATVERDWIVASAWLRRELGTATPIRPETGE